MSFKSEWREWLDAVHELREDSRRYTKQHPYSSRLVLAIAILYAMIEGLRWLVIR